MLADLVVLKMAALSESIDDYFEALSTCHVNEFKLSFSNMIIAKTSQLDELEAIANEFQEIVKDTWPKV